MAEEEEATGARRYIRRKLRIEPTTRVEKTKSSSLRPKLGREAMSPRTAGRHPDDLFGENLEGKLGVSGYSVVPPFGHGCKQSRDGAQGLLFPPRPPPPSPSPSPLPPPAPAPALSPRPPAQQPRWRW